MDDYKLSPTASYLMGKLNGARYCELAQVATDFRKQDREEEIQKAVSQITSRNCRANSSWACIDVLIEWHIEKVYNEAREDALKELY